ncbi:TorD/DmsD family molecular chaperone [Vibrio mytili]|uniref:Dimethyl sulfoxide reductase n=1 Tax=Vibrio mytili TaxID=50718 RepID=A0A0C3HUA3_9VIBR|nr:molecular chaperone [Vibrio mytili]KIN11796.1 dimethyl sulfoxide reductase [Vibrio mytili]
MIIHTLKLLGTLFYEKRSKTESIEIVSALTEENVLRPLTLDALVSLAPEQLEHDFSVLFEGIGTMPVPPWGSVYLDKEQVLFGESNVQYRLFLQAHGLCLDSGQREPEDQFGLMLLACAYLLEQGNKDAAFELIGEHLMPWANAYLEQLQQQAPNTFYQHLANDASTWLQNVVKQNGINVTEKKLYTQR